MKEKCAAAALDFIKEGMTVGLGGGSTVALLLDNILASGKQVAIVTPSTDTEQLCREKGVLPLSLEGLSKIDLAFDGCDELDQNLNALKSCGGIHTREKIVAKMAKDYVLLADEEKWQSQLAFAFPVTVEVIRSAKSLVQTLLEKKGARVSIRQSQGKAGYLISDDGHYLLEAHFEKVEDLEDLNHYLDSLPGVIAHSLFYQVASKAIIAGTDGVQIVEAYRSSKQ
mgnify:CR=1 FL=1